jgi:hypothetical protein
VPHRTATTPGRRLSPDLVLFPYAEPPPTRICYHIINKYLYVDSNDVEFNEQTL